MINDSIYKITHIGPFPPPLGGISVYFYRLMKIHPEFDFIDEKKLSKQKLIALFFDKRRHFIYHNANPKRLLKHAFLWFISRHKFSTMIHGQLQFTYEVNTIITKFWIRIMLTLSESVYVVNLDTKTFLIKQLKILSEKIKLQSPFLPPPLDEEEKIWKTYDEKELLFVKEHRPLIIANASKVVLYNGIDIYGFDMCVDLISRLKNIYPNIGLFFALAEIEDNEYYERINSMIDELGIRNNFFFMTGQKELWPLFKKADLMIRPTTTDGDAVSIREALYFHCPVSASDVSDRPEGTILFKNRNVDDLYDKVLTVLNSKPGK